MPHPVMFPPPGAGCCLEQRKVAPGSCSTWLQVAHALSKDQRSHVLFCTGLRGANLSGGSKQHLAPPLGGVGPAFSGAKQLSCSSIALLWATSLVPCQAGRGGTAVIHHPPPCSFSIKKNGGRPPLEQLAMTVRLAAAHSEHLSFSKLLQGPSSCSVLLLF